MEENIKKLAQEFNLDEKTALEFALKVLEEESENYIKDKYKDEYLNVSLYSGREGAFVAFDSKDDSGGFRISSTKVSPSTRQKLFVCRTENVLRGLFCESYKKDE